MTKKRPQFYPKKMETQSFLLLKAFLLAFPCGESGFCERSEQKTREVIFAKNFADIIHGLR